MNIPFFKYNWCLIGLFLSGLIGQENIVKISDFGMSREEEEYIGEFI